MNGLVLERTDLKAILIAMDELEAYISAVGEEDEAHDRQVWTVKKLRGILASYNTADS